MKLRKINKKVRTIFILANQIYDRDFIEQHTVGEYGVLSSTIFVSDISYKLNKRNSIRFEIQALKSQQLEDLKVKDHMQMALKDLQREIGIWEE